MSREDFDKVLVTGASGRFGRHVVDALTTAGFEVTPTDLAPTHKTDKRITVANLLDPIEVYRLVEGHTTVVHLAALATEHHGSPQKLMTENTTINANVFEAAAAYGVKKIVFSSSIQAVTTNGRLDEGKPSLPYLPMDGDMPPNPGNAYGVSKVMAEEQLKFYSRQYNIQAINLRLAGMFRTGGKWFSYEKVSELPERYWRFIRMDECFSAMLIEDGADLVRRCVELDLPGFRTYLPASRTTMFADPFSELIDRFYSGVPLRKPKEEITGPVDISRIVEETGWNPSDVNHLAG